MSWRTWHTIGAAFLGTISVSCRPDGAPGNWDGAVQSLPNGAVLVRNSGSGVWDTATKRHLVENLRIGSKGSEGPTSLNQVSALIVDPMGRIYVLEHQTQEVRVFNPAGRFVRTIGRKGSGPAEFQDGIGMEWDRRGRFWVIDQRNARYSVFDTAGTLRAEYPRPFSTFFTSAWQGRIDTAGRLYEWYHIFGPSPRPVLLRLDSALQVKDTLPLPWYDGDVLKIERPTMRVSAMVPFAPSLVWTVDPRGYVWFGTTAPYRIHQRRFEGDTVRIIERTYEPLSVTREDRDTAIANLKWFSDQGGKVDRSRIPDVKPAFTGFMLDSRGNLWVQPVVSGGDAGQPFDVFDSEGRYLGRIESRIRFQLKPTLVFRGNDVYGVVLDDDGVPYIVRARLTESPRH